MMAGLTGVRLFPGLSEVTLTLEDIVESAVTLAQRSSTAGRFRIKSALQSFPEEIITVSAGQ